MCPAVHSQAAFDTWATGHTVMSMLDSVKLSPIRSNVSGMIRCFISNTGALFFSVCSEKNSPHRLGRSGPKNSRRMGISADCGRRRTARRTTTPGMETPPSRCRTLVRVVLQMQLFFPLCFMPLCPHGCWHNFI